MTNFHVETVLGNYYGPKVVNKRNNGHYNMCKDFPLILFSIKALIEFGQTTLNSLFLNDF